MPGPSPTPFPAVGLRCDATSRGGVGHLARGLALADEVHARGGSVRVLGEVEDIPWLSEALRARSVEVTPAESDPARLADQAAALGLDAVVLDGYELDRSTGRHLRQAGLAVLSVHDGGWGAGQDADVYVDQNLGASPPPSLPPGSVALAGLDYTLLRDDVLRLRREIGVPPTRHHPPRVLTVFGGTDAFGAAPVLVSLLLETGEPAVVVAVAASEEIAARLRALAPGAGQSLEVLAPTPALAELVAGCDLVVSAAGTSVWELLCLGTPTAVVAVTDNQEIGYTAVLEHGVAAAAGRLEHLRRDPGERTAVGHTLAGLLRDPAAREEMSVRGRRLVDGRGRGRVLDALLHAIATREPTPEDPCAAPES